MRALFSNTRLFYAGFTGVAALTSIASYCSFNKATKAKESVALNKDQFREFTLSDVYPVSHNTKRYRFTFDKEQTLGLTVASCLLLKAPVKDKEGKDVIRPYTPVTDNTEKGFFDLVVKTYPNGAMSKYLDQMSPGQKIEVKGPFLKIEVKPNMKKKIGMIAGGTGITPMYQVINEILKNPKDKTEISLLFANVSEDDILLKNELDLLARKHDNFKVYYTIDRKTTNSWSGETGFVNADMIKKYLPPPSDDNMIFVCGPDPMLKSISGEKGPNFTQGEVGGVLKSLNYTKDQVYKF